jgi:predicted phage tail protein
MNTRKVYLEGEMGQRFVKEFDMAADSFVEVFRCLKCNFNGFTPYLQECHDKNVGFICEVAGKPLKDERELALLYREGDMVITPVPAGSKSGGAKILAAIAITVMTAGMAAAFMGPGALIAGTTGNAALAAGTFGSAFGSLGAFQASLGLAAGTLGGQLALGLAVNLAMTGIQQLMAPDPSTDSQQDESYVFQGSKQNILEGDPVPVLYGELRVPGRTVSFHTRGEQVRFINANMPGTTNTTESGNATGVGPSTTGSVNDSSSVYNGQNSIFTILPSINTSP